VAAERTLIVRLASYVAPLPLAELFPGERPLEVELGSGDGGFLAAYAALHPDRSFLGVERLLGRLRKLDRKGLRAGLENLRLIRLEASYLTEYLLPAGSVAALHIYFPDPWPKRRHHKHRLIDEHFADITRRALAPCGTVYVRTDDAGYFDRIQRVFGAHEGFRATGTPASLSAVPTDFEKEFAARGVPVRRAAYARF
jgi:tRNA (guanine-N7-)-methyltransferase